MTTDNDISPQSAQSSRRWLPGSAVAWGVLLVGVLIAAYPALLAAVLGYLIYPGCFDICGNPAEAAAWDGVAVLVALSPLAALRIYQGGHPASSRSRLAAAAMVVLVPAVLTICAGNGAL